MATLITEQDYQVRMNPSRIIHLTAHNGEKHQFRDGDNFTLLSDSTMRYRGKHVFMSRELIDHLVSNSKKD